MQLPEGFPEWKRKLITDPQTSGGLLVSCAAGAEQEVLKVFSQHGFHDARVIGRLTEVPPGSPSRNGYFSNGRRAFQTRSRMIGWAAAVGWS